MTRLQIEIERLQKLQAAYDKALTSQEYRIGNRSMTRADFKALAEELRRQQLIVDRLQGGSGLQRFIPVDR